MRAMSNLVIGFGGLLFGFGLAMSGMIKPEVVLAFLTFNDLGLLLVLGGAVTVTLLTYQIVPRWRRRPLLESQFNRHQTVGVRHTVVGALLFGIGWGLSGVCPGPAVAGLGAGNWPLLASLAGLFAGAWRHGWWASRHSLPDETAPPFDTRTPNDSTLR